MAVEPLPFGKQGPNPTFEVTALKQRSTCDSTLGITKTTLVTLGMAALGILGGSFAAPAFCFALVKLSPFLPRLFGLAHSISIGALALFAVELVLVALMGSVQLRALIGPAFLPLHAIRTLRCGACARLCFVARSAQFLSVVARCGCSLLGRWRFRHLLSIFREAEALYGPDGV